MKIHELKIESKYMTEKIKGQKLWEIRKNDRNFKTGDLLYLREWSDGVYTGRTIYQSVDNIFNDERYLQHGYVILSGVCFNSAIGDFVKNSNTCHFDMNEIRVIQASLMGCNDQIPVDTVGMSVSSINEKLELMKEIAP